MTGRWRFGKGAKPNADMRIPLNVLKAVPKTLLASPKWKRTINDIISACRNRQPDEIVDEYAASENAEWTNEDAEDVLKAAEANPIFFKP